MPPDIIRSISPRLKPRNKPTSLVHLDAVQHAEEKYGLLTGVWKGVSLRAASAPESGPAWMGGAFQDRQHQAICMLEPYSSIIRIPTLAA